LWVYPVRYDLAWNTLTPKKGLAIIIVVIAFCAPISSYCLDQHISIRSCRWSAPEKSLTRAPLFSFDLTVPEGSKPYTVFEDVDDAFGAGSVFPYKLLFVPTADLCADE
jgi:hypothetical protein